MKRFNYVIDARGIQTLLAQIYDESRDVDSGDLALVLMLFSIGEFLEHGIWSRVLNLFMLSRTILYTSIDVAVSTADHRILQCLVILTFQIHPLALTRSLVPTGFVPFLAITEGVCLEAVTRYSRLVV